jgi:hypothetical protein
MRSFSCLTAALVPLAAPSAADTMGAVVAGASTVTVSATHAPESGYATIEAPKRGRTLANGFHIRSRQYRQTIPARACHGLQCACKCALKARLGFHRTRRACDASGPLTGQTMLKQLLPAEDDEWTDTGDLATPGAMWVFALLILLGRDCFGALRRALECIVQYKGMFICLHLMCKSSKVQDIRYRSSIATEVPAMGQRWFGLAQANVTAAISMALQCETGQIGEDSAVETTSALFSSTAQPQTALKTPGALKKPGLASDAGACMATTNRYPSIQMAQVSHAYGFPRFVDHHTACRIAAIDTERRC